MVILARSRSSRCTVRIGHRREFLDCGRGYFERLQGGGGVSFFPMVPSQFNQTLLGDGEVKISNDVAHLNVYSLSQMY